jgi:putative tryptophan/tyrosine transport system substrate-binding protein
MKSYRLKNIIYSSLAIIISALACFAKAATTSTSISNTQTPTIVAITQIVPHPSLDLIRKGIQDELTDQQIACEFLFENAQGNIATAAQIAQKFVSKNPAVIVPISTPSTQAVYALSNPQNIPVIFAAVNDPVGAKLVPDMQKPGNGITGVSDLPPVKDQVALIREILPEAKNIGIVYNPGESNSVSVLELFERELSKQGLTMVRAAAANMVDVTTATKSLIGKVDAIYIPNDNTVVAALEALLKVAQSNGIPVFCADPESVKQGCLAAVTHSQYGLGRQTGKMVAEFIKGKSLQAMPVQTPAEIELSLNKNVARALKIQFPEEAITRAKYVINE